MIVINGKSVIQKEVEVTEHHLHNCEIWFGSGAVEDSLTPYQLISGNGVFGAEVLLLDSTDTPFRSNKTFFDLHRIEAVDVSSATVYYIRIIWGTGTVAAAETAYQYTTFPILPTGVGVNLSTNPAPIIFDRQPVGTKVWAKCKNATNLATLDMLGGLHEYSD